ncbi:hypothetical protein DCE79_04295 [Lysinibacillus sp. 2017]|uniref:hypothetical protein n=1 Tax=unclassified Lysinibacillus TaxID=2636778 RepID=UPI000D52768F|nr:MULTISPECIES: hypothetical protein [unclassified Lysinibacillus]AWE06658.1 hypothetical protein DCE79_04295 [Lysinibacillus sp. 2017]TGN37410.1 hypothetical protein E4L99_02700 [Lysinibacillus sp. S2017]
MNFASFNPIQASNVQQTVQNQPLALKQDQVFHGTIKQLYPDQMAEVQVGGQKLMAKLEVPLKVGDAHFFQVTSTNPQTELKVVTGPMSQSMTPTQQMNQLLETMNLPKSSDMQQVLSHFIKAQIPISKEQLMTAETWMKNLPEGVSKNDALQALQRMVEYKMPFTNTVFQALTQGAKTDGMSTNLANLAQLLATHTGGNESIKANLLQQIQQLAKPLNNETGGVLLARAAQDLLNASAPVSSKLQALTVLKEAGVLPQNANLQNWQSVNQQPTQVQQTMQAPAGMPQNALPSQAGQMIQQLMQTPPEQSKQMMEQVRSWVNNENLLSTAQKEQIQQLVNRFAQIPPSKQAVEVFVKQLHEQLTKAFSDNASTRLFTQNEQGISAKDQLVSLLKPDSSPQMMDQLLRNLVKVSADSSQPQVQSTLTQAEAQVQSAADSRAMEQAMKTVLKGLGVSYEATLASKAGDVQAVAQQMKPQLLTLIQDAQTPPALRDAAETVMARINGMQLLSSENGHQHQLVMQVPLEFFGKKMDATLQWNGRMKDDGKIDANFARILFYLNMETLQQTVVDMQVQNRVITINIFNDLPNLDSLATSLKGSLKAGLADKEYVLSGVFIKPFEEREGKNVTKNSNQPDEQHSGVDIRV